MLQYVGSIFQLTPFSEGGVSCAKVFPGEMSEGRAKEKVRRRTDHKAFTEILTNGVGCDK